MTSVTVAQVAFVQLLTAEKRSEKMLRLWGGLMGAAVRQ
jgi:hypothetical protein